MKILWLLITLIPFAGVTQIISYSPNRKIEKTVSESYYDTEFLYLKNITTQKIELTFEVIENTLDANWSATLCTNRQCFSNVPSAGSLGPVSPTEEGYISFNFSANETLGTGKLRLLINSPEEASLSDTVTFEYTVTGDGTEEPRPWANINYGEGVLTVLLENPQIETTLQVISLNGRFIFDEVISHITSIPLRDYPKGLYIVAIKDENDRFIREKLIHY